MVAVIVALLAMVLLMFAAYAVDIGVQVNRKHLLNDTLDAAAQAGAFELPGSSVTAKAEALEFAVAHDPSETGTLAPNVDFWCVVSSKLTSGVYQPNPIQIPRPATRARPPTPRGPTTRQPAARSRAARSCVPSHAWSRCRTRGTPKIACNTIRVFQGRDVPFGFAPAGGIQEGSTGNVVSVACKGSCGTVAPNPMDVAVVADRTGSMSDTDLAAMKSGIKGMLAADDPYPAVRRLRHHRAVERRVNPRQRACVRPAPVEPLRRTTTSERGSRSRSRTTTSTLHGTAANSGSGLVKAVDLPATSPGTGTTLAAPAKAAARYLLGLTGSPNNLGSLAVPSRSRRPRCLIFETDGQPNEPRPRGGSTSLTDPSDIFSNTTTPKRTRDHGR